MTHCLASGCSSFLGPFQGPWAVPRRLGLVGSPATSRVTHRPGEQPLRMGLPGSLSLRGKGQRQAEREGGSGEGAREEAERAEGGRRSQLSQHEAGEPRAACSSPAWEPWAWALDRMTHGHRLLCALPLCAPPCACPPLRTPLCAAPCACPPVCTLLANPLSTSPLCMPCGPG